MSNKTYDFLKWVALILLPALGALYFGLSKYWMLPYPEEVVGTITVIDTFLGSVIQVSKSMYNNSSAGKEGTPHDDEHISGTDAP